MKTLFRPALIVALLVAGWLVPTPASAATIITVDTTADDGTVNGNCTLREAIIASNTDAAVDACPAGSGVDTIAFDIPGAGPHTIAAGSALPQISQPLMIDGYCGTCDGASPNTLAVGNDAVITIALDGTGAGAVNGLELGQFADGSTIRGLAIHGFDLDGIRIGSGSEGNVVAGSYLGLDAAGTAQGNGEDGIEVNSASGNTVGGTAPADRNVISDNVANGVNLVGSTASATVQGNHIGTNPAGTTAIGNAASGVATFFAAGATIGGPAAGAGNVISGNGFEGIRVSDGAIVVQGNRIGTDAAATADLGNGSDGVILTGGSHTVGGTGSGEGNLISSNDGNGIQVWSDGNTIAGNTIGLDTTGLVQLGNGGLFSGAGVDLTSGASGNTVEDNHIAGNTFEGVRIDGMGTTGNVVTDNLVGLDAAGGDFTSPAQDSGVVIAFGATDNVIGEAGAGNVLSGNAVSGIEIRDAGTSRNVVQGNLIGTDPVGTSDRGNSTYGVRLQAPDNAIGGVGAGDGNVIGFNPNGVALQSPDAAGNVVEGNGIGTNLSGTANLGNVSLGVFFSNASGNMIGGTEPGAGNHVAFNGIGIRVGSAPTSVGNAFLGNAIHDNLGLGIDLEGGVQDAFLVTANDGPGDADAGPNDLQNFPDLSVAANGSTNVLGTLEGEPSGGYRLEFFSVPAGEGDGSGHGEGRAFLGAGEVTTDGSGVALFGFSFDPDTPVGDLVSATATKLGPGGVPGSTSEFSQNVTVEACPTAPPGGGTLIGGPGDDILCGGPGDDIFIGGGGNDLFLGRGGTDTADYSGNPTGITADLAAGTVEGASTDFLSGLENVVGSAHGDTLLGDDGPNTLSGGGGNDILEGGPGNDTLSGGDGDDTLEGGGGDDTLAGGAGNDAMDGGAGNDTFLLPGASPDGADAVTGGPGIDTADYSGRTENLSLSLDGAANDGAEGEGDNLDVENLLAGSGNDLLQGKPGGANLLDGGPGTDTVTYATAGAGVTADLGVGTASEDGGGAADVLAGIENLTGTPFDDSLTGDGGDNTLIGGPGNDLLRGLGGKDTLNAGAGSDKAAGGPGRDTLLGKGGKDLLRGGGGKDVIKGGGGNDRLRGQGGADVLRGQGGNDDIKGQAGRDRLFGNAGNDSLNGGGGKKDFCKPGGGKNNTVKNCELP